MCTDANAFRGQKVRAARDKTGNISSVSFTFHHYGSTSERPLLQKHQQLRQIWERTTHTAERVAVKRSSGFSVVGNMKYTKQNFIGYIICERAVMFASCLPLHACYEHDKQPLSGVCRNQGRETQKLSIYFSLLQMF